jgi:hypothetical protein
VSGLFCRYLLPSSATSLSPRAKLRVSRNGRRTHYGIAGLRIASRSRMMLRARPVTIKRLCTGTIGRSQPEQMGKGGSPFYPAGVREIRRPFELIAARA